MENCSKFFCNKQCEYFPCHKTDNPDDFNCLFCYCPLYNMNDCGGNPIYIDDSIDRADDGPRMVVTFRVKDCSECMLPHSPNGWDHIVKKLASERK